MSKNNINLENRTAIVTGGAQGIGRAIVERFVESGARCMIWDQDGHLAEQAASEIGSGTLSKSVDIADADAVESATQEAAEAMGTIDILVTSAGVAGLNAMVWEYPVDEWKRVHAINLDGTFICARSIVPTAKEYTAANLSKSAEKPKYTQMFQSQIMIWTGSSWRPSIARQSTRMISSKSTRTEDHRVRNVADSPYRHLCLPVIGVSHPTIRQSITDQQPAPGRSRNCVMCWLISQPDRSD